MLENMTFSHEHIHVDLSGPKKTDDCNLNCKEETIKELKNLYNLGVRNIVEVTNIGMGRDVAYMEEVKQKSGINLIYSTGFYKEPFLPDFFIKSSVEDLANLMIKELLVGMDSTNVRAQVIGEIGTSKDEMKPEELKLFQAAVIASKKTGAPISTHTTLGTCVLQQAKFFLENDVIPSKVYIGHCDIGGNISEILEVLKMGFYVGFDTINKNNYFPDDKRCEMLKEIEKAGYISQVMLSQDITRKSQLHFNGGYGYDSLLTYFVPKLREYGLKEESIKMMLVDNPKNYLKGII